MKGLGQRQWLIKISWDKALERIIVITGKEHVISTYKSLVEYELSNKAGYISLVIITLLILLVKKCCYCFVQENTGAASFLNFLWIKGKKNNIPYNTYISYWNHNVALARFQNICNIMLIKKFIFYSSDVYKANLLPRTYTTAYVDNINCIKIGWWWEDSWNDCEKAKAERNNHKFRENNLKICKIKAENRYLENTILTLLDSSHSSS